MKYYSPMPTPHQPEDPVAHINLLHKSFVAGDVIALIQAERFAREAGMCTPAWVMETMEDTFVGVLTRRSGQKGKGNSAFGYLRKALLRTVRASAYRYIRAWQRDPHRYHDLPIQTFEDWAADKISWNSYRTAGDAARLASTSLHATEYVANASTVRRAANRFPIPVRWGREAAECALGLRGPEGVFGPNPDYLQSHISSLLAKRQPKPE